MSDSIRPVLRIRALFATVMVVAIVVLTIPPVRTMFIAIPAVEDIVVAFYNWRNPAKYPWQTHRQAGDAGPAEQINLMDPAGVATDGAGNIYVADRARFIWRIDPSGHAAIVAGTGRKGKAEPSSDAKKVDLGSPQGICIDGEGRIVFADSSAHVIARVNNDGALVRVAGTGRKGNSGDGAPAIGAELRFPYDVRCAPNGEIYILEHGNHMVRKVTRDGRIVRVAGIGESGYSGDGGPAVDARLNGPYGVAADQRGGFYIADSSNHVVRYVDAHGIITTIAGTGEKGGGSDGGPALQAQFNMPEALGIDAAGILYIGDEHNHRVRRLGRDGVITTVAGTGTAGFNGDGKPATETQLNDPEYVFPRADGSMLIADGDNGRVRLVTADGVVRSIAGRGRDPHAPRWSGKRP